jgi:hypothetical protein
VPAFEIAPDFDGRCWFDPPAAGAFEAGLPRKRWPTARPQPRNQPQTHLVWRPVAECAARSGSPLLSSSNSCPGCGTAPLR